MTTDLPNKLHDCLWEILKISDALKSVLAYGEHSDVRLCLQTLNLSRQCHGYIRKVGLSVRIREAKDDKNNLRPSYPDSVFDCFAALWDRFFERDRDTGEIEKLIRKYTDTTWNHLHPDSHLFIYAVSKCDITDVADWLKAQHYLYYPIKLAPIDATVEKLNEYASSQGWTLADFFDPAVVRGNTVDSEWVKAHINSIKRPIIVQSNSTSIYDAGKKPIGFVQIGFVEVELEKALTQ